jgi:hypothetical protein
VLRQSTAQPITLPHPIAYNAVARDYDADGGAKSRTQTSSDYAREQCVDLGFAITPAPRPQFLSLLE